MLLLLFPKSRGSYAQLSVEIELAKPIVLGYWEQILGKMLEMLTIILSSPLIMALLSTKSTAAGKPWLLMMVLRFGRLSSVPNCMDDSLL